MSFITPGPQSLGLASPVLGPWFDDNSETLGLPGSRLEVAHTFGAARAWWPPAGGTLSLAVSTPVRPKLLRALTDALGNAAFGNNRLVAVFTLLPEVEDRLEVLSALLPRPDAGVGGAPARARVRTLAIELPDAAASRLGYFGSGSAEDYGLVANNDGTLGNGTLAMCDLKRPGLVPPIARQVLANFPAGLAVTVWAFDAEGFAIDPGAVANWWWAIAAGNVPPWDSTTNPLTWASNMWADVLHPRTCATTPTLGFRVVNPHRGVIDAALRGRLRITAGAASTVAGNPDLYRVTNAATGATLGFSAAPGGSTPDTVPIPLLAMLPIGNHGTALALWTGGATAVPGHPPAGATTIARDHVEVSALDAESFVCGIQRGNIDNPATPAGRRVSDQNRVATRINVMRSQVLPMTTADNVAWAFAQLPDGSNPVAIVAPAYDHDWGALGLTGLPTAGANAPVLPNVLPPLQVFPLVGGGAASGNTVGEQQVVVRLALDATSNLAGAWVRIYPNKLDVASGKRVPQPGGAGRFGNAAAIGTTETLAHVVVSLPAGEDGGGLALTSVDVLIFDGVNPPRLYAGQRFTRPVAVTGDAIAFSDVAAPNRLLLVCDLGTEIDTSQSPAPSVIPSGATLLARHDEPGTFDETFTLVDRNTVPLVWLLPNTAARALLAADVIALTSPAFVGEERGNLRATSDPESNADVVVLAAQVRNQGRNGIANLGTAGAPLPTMQRLELVGLVNAGAAGNNAAALGSAPALARWHEITPITAGNPTAPAGPDVHGAGLRIVGGSITDIADVIRDRLFPASDDLINDAGSNPLPAQAVALAAAQWSAVLKTVAQGVEGEPFLFDFAGMADGAIEDAYDAMVAAGVLTAPAASANTVNAMRAFGRRFVNALGRQETLYALNAAITRAQRLIYIETPALDGEAVTGPVTGTGAAAVSPLAWLDTLIATLGTVPALQVALCVPIELLPGTPTPLTWVRNELWHRALDRLLDAAGDRIAIFSPGAGPLRAARMASSVVIVDDVWALVGNTHLWRRGLSFDSSLAVALFDEATLFSRGALVSALRVQLAADRLGATPAQIPLIAQEFVAAIRRLAAGGGAGRLAVSTIARAPAADRPTDTDLTLWNRDGSVSGDADLLAWLANIAGFATTN